MPQTSLTTWLNKPSAVKEPLASSKDDEIVPTAEPSQVPTQSQRGDDEDIKSTPQKPAAPTFGVTARPLPPNVDLRACTKEDLPHLKRLNSLILPLSYPEKFYKEIIEDSLTNSITILAVWHDDPSKKGFEKGRLVGVIRCRLLPELHSQSGPPKKSEPPMLYLSTLALLSPYRSFGIATHMLRVLTNRAITDYGISSVGAHVWESNTEGLDWYRKRGFREIGREPGYYPRLDPQAATVVKRDISVIDIMGK